MRRRTRAERLRWTPKFRDRGEAFPRRRTYRPAKPTVVCGWRSMTQLQFGLFPLGSLSAGPVCRLAEAGRSVYSASPPDSGSFNGVEITYPPLAHLPRSIVRHRSLQNGNSGSSFRTSLRQVGHRKLFSFFLAIKQKRVVNLSSESVDFDLRLPTYTNLATKSYSCASVISQR